MMGQDISRRTTPMTPEELAAYPDLPECLDRRGLRDSGGLQAKRKIERVRLRRNA